jgi:hypothetical protein
MGAWIFSHWEKAIWSLLSRARDLDSENGI